MNRSGATQIVFLLLAMVLAGCSRGGDAVAVSGTVTLDGQPLDKAAVMFSGPEGKSPVTAMTDAAGRFYLEAAPGPSQVAVAKNAAGGSEAVTASAEDALMPATGAPAVAPQSPVPEKYSKMQTSGLQVDVQSGMAPVEIKLASD